MTKHVEARMGMGTLVNHAAEGDNPHRAHVTPIYQTTLFSFPDVATGAAVFKGEQEGFIYTRSGNPNAERLARKYALLEAIDLWRAEPDRRPREIAAGLLFTSGMAAIASAILAKVRAGDKLLAQHALYGGTFGFLDEVAPDLGLEVIWVQGEGAQAWAEAFDAHPDAPLAYVETPVNPTMAIVDLAAVVEVAHAHGAWVMVDNTFASPYCQRPLSLGVDVVVHSTTKYLVGHGVVIGGAVISTHLDYIRQEVHRVRRRLGGSPSPFDTWLANMGLKTFEIRMERHCANAMRLAEFLAAHSKVERVHYPGLPNHPGHQVAKRQMSAFGGMLSFELKGGFEAAERTLDHLRLPTLGVSLGNVDTLVEHPAGMTHAGVPRQVREQMGLSDGLVRLSVGIENVEDLIADLDAALEHA